MAELSSDNDVLLAVIGGSEPGDDLVIDCLISDNHNYDAEVTDFPVESGSTISDNIRNKPLVVTMECIVTNSPIGQAVNFREPGSVPADTAYAAMLKIRDKRQPVTIRTSLSTFRNMALQNLTIPRESGRGDELRFTATFKQIEIVVNRRDKRVAIVGAKSGGVKTFTLIRDPSMTTAFIHLPDLTWYDPEIGGWRKSVQLPNFIKVQGIGVSDLFAEQPIDIPADVWANERVDQHTIPLLRPRIKASQGGTYRTVFYKKNPRDILTLNKGQFRVVRLS